MNNQSLLRLPSVMHRLGNSRSLIYKLITNNLFPPPIKYGPRMSVWPESEVDAIISARIQCKTENEIRSLVKNLVAKRKEAALTRSV